MSQRLSSRLRVLISSLVIIALLLPGATLFAPPALLAQSDSPPLPS